MGDMPGVTWSERQPTDWLASNGRWYPANKYPNGWSTSALPPAPGHGGVGSILRRYADSAAAAVGLAPSGASDLSSQQTPSPQAVGSDAWDTGSYDPDWDARNDSTSTRPSSDVVPTGRTVADATVTAQRTYAAPVGAGAPPPPAIATPRDDGLPPAPGRIRSDDLPAPAPPVKTNTPYIPQPSPPAKPFDVMAGDLGRVLGTAKRRIERAIDDASTS